MQTQIAAIMHTHDDCYNVVLVRDGEHRLVRNWRYVYALAGSKRLEEAWRGADEELTAADWQALQEDMLDCMD